MAEDSSLYSSFPVAHQANCNLVSNVEDAENEQPVSSSSSSLDSKKLPTGTQKWRHNEHCVERTG